MAGRADLGAFGVGVSRGRDKDEGGLLPLAVLVGMLLLVIAYGVGRGFLTTSPRLADRPVRLVVAFPGSTETAAAYRDVAETFEAANPGVAVDLRPIFGSKYYQKVLVMMASGTPPDLMWMGQGFAEFAHRGAFLDVTERVERDVERERYIPQSLEWYRFGGRQIGVAFAIDLQFIVYNRDLFDAAAVPYPAPGWGYDEFLDAAKRLTRDFNGDGHIDQYGYFGQLIPCLFGAEFISEDGLHATCDSPQMIRCLEVNRALMHDDRVIPSMQQQAQGSLDKMMMFGGGHVAMMQVSTWDLPQLRRQAGVPWALTLNPRVERRATWASSQAVLVSAETAYPDEAWALARAFLTPSFQRRAASHAMPTDRALAASLGATGEQAYSHLPVLLKAVDELCPTPRVAHLAEAQQIYATACESVWSGRATPAEAMRRAARLIDRMIREHGRYRQ